MIRSMVIDEDKLAQSKGYRNFSSFIFITYFGENKLSSIKCAKLLGISATKIRLLMIERGWRLRSVKDAPRPKPKKRRMNLIRKVKENTPFTDPRNALYVYYVKYGLTTFETGKAIGISQSSVCKLLKKYKIPRRSQGRKSC